MESRQGNLAFPSDQVIRAGASPPAICRAGNPVLMIRVVTEWHEGLICFKVLTKYINLKINPGQKVAITGSVGCGKTTLVNLIPRIFPAEHNKILLDDIDINKIDIKELMKH